MQEIVPLFRASNKKQPLGIDVVEPPILFALQKEGITIVDGQQLMSDARVIKTQDEIYLLNHSAMMVDAAYDELYRAMKPGMGENQAVGVASKVLYDLGSEYVEAVNAISGERCNRHPHVFSDRVLRPGDPVYYDILHSYMGYRTCYYRCFTIGYASHAMIDAYKLCRDYLDASTSLIQPRRTTAEIASVWPKAEELGFPDEEAAFALQFGHGIGLAIWEKPVISRMVSLEHSHEIKPGMVFALETFWPSKDGWSAARIEEEIVPFSDGSYLTLWRDLDRTCAEFAKFSKKDGAAYRRMITEDETIRPILSEVTFNPIGFGKPLNGRLAEHPQGKLWQRRLAMSAWEIVRDTFEDDHCRAFTMGCPYALQPLQDPGSGRAAYIPLHQQRESRPLPKGGSGALTEALSRFIEAHGGTILTNKWITSLIVENGKCTGVECVDGTSYRGTKAVLSTIHIKQLVDMAPRELWGQDFVDGVDTWDAGLTLFATNYAMKESPEYRTDAGILSPVHSGMMASADRALHMSVDYATGAVNLTDPPLHVICCSLADSSRAPAGMHSVKGVAYQPYALKEGPQHWDAIKQKVSDANLKCLQRFATNLTDDKVLARTIESPLDLERMNPHNWHGSCHVGGSSLAQSGAMRPMPGWAQHRMPIPGLYQTGATTHPGGSVTGGPGRNAAAVMLKDFGTSIAEVIQKT